LRIWLAPKDTIRSIADVFIRRSAQIHATLGLSTPTLNGWEARIVKMSYARFAAMIGTSTVVMYAAMYLNTYAIDHVLWSETRAWMALLMGAVMATVMLGFMASMYPSQRVNAVIFGLSAAVFAGSLWLVRSQATVDDVDYMSAMVPHHSIAIMTSERAHISDPRVRELADEIIEAQRREIAEMKLLLKDLRDMD
jgi:heme A synthase